MKDYAEVYALLDRHPASIMVERNFLGQTAFHLAVQNPKMLQYLVEKGSTDSINARDRNGTTPFMYAAAYNQRESAMLLLNAGVDVNIFDKLNGLNFLGYAMVRGNFELLREFVDHYRRLRDAESVQHILDFCLWNYMVSNHCRMQDMDGAGLRYFLEAGGDLRTTSERGNTLLHLACHSYEAEVILDHTGYPVNQQNHRGYTPLMVLARLGNPALIRRIVSEGALVNIVDSEKMSALHHLIRNVQPHALDFDYTRNRINYMNSITVLLVCGSDVLQGDTCLCACWLLVVQ